MKGSIIILTVFFSMKLISAQNISCSDVPHGDLIPYPGNCNNFYQCVGCNPVKMYCPNGLHFNAVLKVCDWPQNANCTIVPEVNTTTTIEPETTTSQNSTTTISTTTTPQNLTTTTIEPETTTKNLTLTTED